MATTEVGRDGAYRMTIESRYEKVAGVRRESKFFAILGGFYGFIKLSIASIPTFVYGEEANLPYLAGVGAVVLVFLLFAFASGAGKPHKEIVPILWLYVVAAGAAGSKALLNAWNNPFARSLLSMAAPPETTPYDQAFAKVLVQKLNIDPAAAVLDVDVINLVLEAGGALALLAAAAATAKYLQLRRQPTKVKLTKKAA